MQRNSVGHDRFDLRQKARRGAHHEAGRPLAMDDRFHLGRACLRQHLLHGSGMVEDCRLVQGPTVGRQINAGAPILQPDVVALLGEEIDQRDLDARPEDVGAHPGTVDEQNRPLGGRTLALDVDQVAPEPVPGCKGHHRFGRHNYAPIAYQRGATLQ